MEDATYARERTDGPRPRDLSDVVLGGVRPEPAPRGAGRRDSRGAGDGTRRLVGAGAAAIMEMAARVGDRRARQARYEARSVLLLALVVGVLVGVAAWAATTSIDRVNEGAAASNAAGQGKRAAASGVAAAAPNVPFDLEAATSAPTPEGKLLDDAKPSAAPAHAATAGLPELAISGIVVVPSASTGGAPTVRVSVGAVGVDDDAAGASAGVDVLLLVDGELVGTQRMDGGALAGGAASASFSLPTCDEGTHQAVAVVDPSGEMAEGRERDNVRMREIDVAC